MSKVYRIAWNVSTNTWAVASGTARVRGRGAFCVTLSGIAAAVTFGVPVSRIAQAAPAASYMVAAGAAQDVTDRRAIARADTDDFWRIARAQRAAEPDDRVVVVRRVARERRPEGGPGADANAPISDEPARIDASAPAAEPRADNRYDTASGAMSVPFYNFTRRPEAPPVRAGAWSPHAGHDAPAWMNGAGLRYLGADRRDRATAESPAPADAATAVQTTTAVDGAKIRSIRFDGNTVFSAAVLRDEMQLSATNWTSWYTKDDVYSRDRLAAALEGLRRYYLDRGYLEFRHESVRTTTAPDGDGVALAIELHEGPQYTLSSVRLAGSPPGLEPALDALVQNRVGQPLSIGQLLATRAAILDRLGADGYAQAAVTPQLQPDAARHAIDLTLQVEPGPRVAVRRIEIGGNTITRDEVVRREMRQMEGDWYDPAQVVRSRDRLNRLGYFSDVDVKTAPANGARDQIDVQVKVVEQPSAPISLGAGFSSTERFVASAGIVHDNVLGTGQSIGASVASGKSFRAVTLTQSNPYFTDGGVRRTTRAYYRANEPLYYSGDSRFKIEATGIDLRFSVPVGAADQFHAGAAVEHYRLAPDGNAPSAWREHVAKDGRESGNLPLVVGWSRDRLDNAAAPQRGYAVHAGVEYGTPVAGNHYYKVDANAQWHRAFAAGVVLGASVHGGYGGGLGHRAYPLFKRYYAGGIGSVRGYEPGSLSPRDAKTGQPIGGSSMLAGSVELRAPLRPVDPRLSAFAFVDGGNAWDAPAASIGSNGLRFGYGAGLAWGSPIGAFKVSVGLPVARRESDRYQAVQMEFRAEL